VSAKTIDARWQSTSLAALAGLALVRRRRRRRGSLDGLTVDHRRTPLGR
jgi:hypothetical protein